MIDLLPSEDGKPAAVILDLDGLVLDTERLARRACQRAAAECGYVIDDPLHTCTIGLTPEDTARIYVEALSRPRWRESWKSST
ncbi:MAG: hypothetical protein PVG71_07255 [Anaerolineae bacterium]